MSKYRVRSHLDAVRISSSRSWSVLRSANPSASMTQLCARWRLLFRRAEMRLKILDNGHGLATKALFALIATASRKPVLDIIKLVKYRPDFYGNAMARVT